MLAWQESEERARQQRLAEEQFALLQGTAREAEQMVQDALSRLEDPTHIGCTGSAGGFPCACQTWYDQAFCCHAKPCSMPSSGGRAAMPIF